VREKREQQGRPGEPPIRIPTLPSGTKPKPNQTKPLLSCPVLACPRREEKEKKITPRKPEQPGCGADNIVY